MADNEKVMSDEEQPERRRFRRVSFAAPAVLSQGQVSHLVSVADISLKGVLVEVFESVGLDLKRPLHLHITLAENVAIAMELRHIHNAKDHCGFQCTSIDLDSIGHLRRVIEFNLGDPLAAERDLADLFS